jgi:hypothetical protein
LRGLFQPILILPSPGTYPWSSSRIAEGRSALPERLMYGSMSLNVIPQVALWCQKLANEPHWPVVWDYHVVLVLRLRNHVFSRNGNDMRCVPAVDEITHSWVYDFDTVLDLPCTLQGKSFSKPLTFTDLAPDGQSTWTGHSKRLALIFKGM